MSDHHDFGSYDDHHDPLPFDDDTPGHDLFADHVVDHDDHGGWDEHLDGEHVDPGHDAGHQQEQHESEPEPEPAPELTEAAASTVAVDDHVEVFPPVVDVGELPEPVDGFPWIDTGSLGVVDPAVLATHVDEVRPEELAEYAGTDLPPGVDPWAALADSDDPATSALARWWSQN